jgi:hypothetical protein
MAIHCWAAKNSLRGTHIFYLDVICFAFTSLCYLANIWFGFQDPFFSSTWDEFDESRNQMMKKNSDFWVRPVKRLHAITV